MTERLDAPPRLSTSTKAALAAALTVVLWASAFVAIRDVGHSISAAPLALIRLVVAAAALTVPILLRRGRATRMPVTGKALGLIALYGVLWLAGYTVALNAGEQHVDAGTAALLVNIAPLLVAFGAGLFLGEGFPRPLLVGSAVALGGVAIIAAGSGGRNDGAGVLLCLLAAVLYAAGVLIQKFTLRHADGLTITWLGCVLGAVALLPWLPQLVAELRSAPASAVLGAVYLGLVPTALGFSTWAYALRRTDAGRLSASTYAVPAVSVLLSWLLLSEVPTAYGFVGGAICLVGVAISRRRPRGRRSAVGQPQADDAGDDEREAAEARC
ncbi:drug/metabolite transporter (DMT)-like permease [Prauserella shujinwangii]|uniref:Drug/metabolite transporter (DMT)-like permease n=1 Tax=Prauserella shujinwangii TaxID=1453103 RepID=A0A2T0LMK3_9PSEU|nr:DMT family transporter [Prauserella shujinwangii]PRX44309.1 drug/metabolite transporter (DMT)-like permease [Prauserella shujinwangii]